MTLIWAGWILAASQAATQPCSAARLSEAAKAIFEFTCPGGVEINVQAGTEAGAKELALMYQDKAVVARRRRLARQELALAIQACEPPPHECPPEGCATGTVRWTWSNSVLVGAPPSWDDYLGTGDVR